MQRLPHDHARRTTKCANCSAPMLLPTGYCGLCTRRWPMLLKLLHVRAAHRNA